MTIGSPDHEDIDVHAVAVRGRLAVATFLLGNGISLIGNSLAFMAIPWFVIETTGSASRTGLVGMAAALPVFASGVLGGPLIDRLGGRRMSVISDIISGVSLALIPFLHATTGLAFWQLLLLVFIGAALDIPGLTARRTLLPELADGGAIRPETMNSAFETMQGLSLIIGSAVAGLLIGLIGTVNLLWITGSTFAISAVLIGLFSPSGKHEADPEGAHAASGFGAELMLGLRFLRTDALLLSLAIGLTCINILQQPFWTVVLPVRIEERFGVASRFGLMLTVFGIGNLIGGALYGMVGHRFGTHRRLLYLCGLASFTALLWILVPDVPYAVMIVAAFLVGLIGGPINPLLVTVRLERIPKELRGRVFATFSALTGAAVPLGMIVMGWLLDAAGVRAGMVVLATVATIFTIGLFLTPPYRDMDVVEGSSTG